MEKISRAFRERIVKDFRHGGTLKHLARKHAMSKDDIKAVLQAEIPQEYEYYMNHPGGDSFSDMPNDIDANNEHLKEEFAKREVFTFLAQQVAA